VHKFHVKTCLQLGRQAVCGSGVPPYDFLNLYGIFNSGFSASVSQKRLELKSFKGRTKAEELGDLVPHSSAFVLPLRLFSSSRFSRKLTENGGTEGPLLKQI
jgi:hypothetical protein